MRPVNAFLIVDVQNDFISGSLDISNCSAQQQGHEVRPGVGEKKERKKKKYNEAKAKIILKLAVVSRGLWPQIGQQLS